MNTRVEINNYNNNNNNNIVYKNLKSEIKGIEDGFTVIDNKKYNYSLVMDKIIVVKEILNEDTNQRQSSKSNKFIVLEKSLFLNSTTAYDEVNAIVASNFPMFLLDGNSVIDFIYMGINRAKSSGHYSPGFAQDMENIISIIHDFNGEDYEEFYEIVLLNKASKYDNRLVELVKNILFSMSKNNHIFKIINPNIHEYIFAMKVAFEIIDVGATNLDNILNKNKESQERDLNGNLIMNETAVVDYQAEAPSIEKIPEDVGFVSQLFSEEDSIELGSNEEFLNSAMYDDVVNIPVVDIELEGNDGNMDEYYSIVNEVNSNHNDIQNVRDEKEEVVIEEKTIDDIKPEFQNIQIDPDNLSNIVEKNKELNPNIEDEIIIESLKDAKFDDTELITEAPSKEIIEDSPEIELFPEGEVLEDSYIERDILTSDEIHSQNIIEAEEAFKENDKDVENRKECLQSRREELGDIEGNSVEKEEEIHEKNNEEDLVENQDPEGFFSQPAPEN